MTEWISVKDRLPDTRVVEVVTEEEAERFGTKSIFQNRSDCVLVIPKSCYENGHYAPMISRIVDGHWEFMNYFGIAVADDVVFWMPLPEPPKEMNGNDG